MSWQGIEGHDEVVETFRRAIARNHLASTFLFVGPSGVGKRTFAEKLAQALLCPNLDPETLSPCGRCDSCHQVASRTHPDLMIVEKPTDKSEIPLELLIGDKEHRMREGLCHDIALRPFMGGRKVAIIDDADFLNEEGANALLKTLEEPPPRSMLILIGTGVERQLPTIRSRAQSIRFRPLPVDVVAGLLLAKGLASDDEQAQRMARFSAGSMQQAVEMADEELQDFRSQLWSALAASPLDSVALAALLLPFVDAAGKEARPRRARARHLVSFAIDFYRQALRSLPAEHDAELQREIRHVTNKAAITQQAAAAAIERSLDTLEQIDRNAYLPTALECWLDDLARIAEGQHVAGFAGY